MTLASSSTTGLRDATSAPDAPMAVTWDFGQTLADLDPVFLAQKLAENGVSASASALDGAVPAAWGVYNRAVRGGAGGHPWKTFMRAVLSGAGIGAARIDDLAEVLWQDQPARNLWRRPVPGMMDLVRELDAAGVPQGIVSNSEGRLAELVRELGWSAPFRAIADSGKLGVEKPGRGIFDWCAERIGVPVERIVHIGDAHAVDVDGAVAAGMRAIWFRGEKGRDTRPEVATCDDAGEVRAALAAWAPNFFRRGGARG
jgi:HAD superfamily hydrolase (TIGR01509 family)